MQQDVLSVVIYFNDRIAPAEVRTSGDLDRAIEDATRGRVDGLLVLRNSLFYVLRKLIVSLAEKSRLPGLYHSSEFVEAGGLMSYVANRLAGGKLTMNGLSAIIFYGFPTAEALRLKNHIS
ncbi:MAG: hypothetical protein E6J54_29885 [Deltaproteobacteria bacterium]|nr:MAG: hypothetical protein E6J54_29885 [Deltaproteobacteria bacterium]